jgi:O-antigen ligase
LASRVRRRSSRSGSASGFSAIWRGRSPQHVVFYLLLAFLFACVVGGGSNRATTPSLLYLRPLTVICLFCMLVVPAESNWRLVRTPLLLLGLLWAIILAQLIPLPPSIWDTLPGHGPLAGASVALGGQQPWRPISLTPDFTINSLLSLLIPLTVLVGYAKIAPDQRQSLVPLIIGVGVASAVLGIIQFPGGSNSPANLYDHSLPVPNGWFANRNHHAAFLASVLLLIATWLQFPARSHRYRLWRYALAALAALLLLAVVIATGSRTGTLLALAALTYGAAVTLLSFGKVTKRAGVIVSVAVAIVLMLVGSMLLSGRAVAFTRLFAFDPDAEQRVRALPTLITMFRDFMPVGSGFGSFDPVFRMYEPDALLHPGYFNHAHNDWLELGITGGLPALLVLALFCVWVAVASVRSFRQPASPMVHCARSAGAILLVLGAASISDYPLRAPVLAAFMALACAWLADGRRQATSAPPRGAR